LARHAAATQFSAAPAAVQERVVALVADCLAVTSLGSRRPELRKLKSTLGGVTPQGAATVIGSSRGWPPATAALLNATALAADQLQDGHRCARGHPASHVVPAVLAYAEELDASAEAALSAILAGYEVGTRIGIAMGGTPAGMHDIGTWGEIAVATAVAQLLHPGDTDTVHRAIELAASALLVSDARTIFSGRTGGHLFLGASAELGCTLGLAAVAGLEAEPGSLERHLATVGAKDWDPSRIDEDQPGMEPDPWPRYEVLRGYIKLHPTCAHLHGVNDAIENLISLRRSAGHELVGREITSVRVRTYSAAATFGQVAGTELDARFSIPTSVALALLDGRLVETPQTSARVNSAEVVSLAERVQVIHDPAMDAGYPAGRPTEVSITMADGTEYTDRVERPRGDSDHPLMNARVRAKAKVLFALGFGDTVGSELLEAVQGWPVGLTPRELGVAIRAAANPEKPDSTMVTDPDTGQSSSSHA
jgi:2-methylcitrate dehydratase PrpD